MARKTGHSLIISGHIRNPSHPLISRVRITVCKAVMQAKPHPHPSDLHFDLRVGAVPPRPHLEIKLYLVTYC